MSKYTQQIATLRAANMHLKSVSQLLCLAREQEYARHPSLLLDVMEKQDARLEDNNIGAELELVNAILECNDQHKILTDNISKILNNTHLGMAPTSQLAH